MGVLGRASARYLLRHPAQLLLSVLGVALGVAVVAGVDLASASALRAFELSGDAVAGAATHQLRAGPEGLDERVHARLRCLPLPPAAAPVLEHPLEVLGSPPRTLTLLGIDPLAEAPFRPWLRQEGAAGKAALALLVEPRGVLLAAPTARELGLAPGDALRLRIGGRELEARLVGVLDPGDALSARALEGLLVTDVSTAQELLDAVGTLTRIDLRLPEEPEALERELARLAPLLPPGAWIEPTAARGQTMASMTRAFRLNLRALGLLALIVGVFLVYNTMTFSVLQRRELWGALRTLGASRAQVFALVLGEALGVGVAGSVLGLAAGIALGQSLLGLVAQSINDLYFAVEVRAVELSPTTLARALGLGLLATLAGGLAPAFEATRAAPRVAQSRSRIETSARALARPLGLAGVACAGLALLLLALPSRSLGLAFAALTGLLLSSACFAPLATIAGSRALGRLLGAAAGPLGRMAARGLEASLSRSAVTIAALSVALSVTVGMGVMVASFRAGVERWLASTLIADVYVSAPSLVSSRNESLLPPELVERALALPGVESHSTYRGFEAQRPGHEPLQAAALQVAARGREPFELLAGEPRSVWLAFDAGALLISEPLARRLELAPGDRLELATARGPRAFEIAGVYRDYSSDRGFALVARAHFERWWNGGGVSSLGLFLAPGVDPDAVVATLRASLRPGESAHVRSTRALRQASMDVFERTFAVTGVLRLLAIVVAGIGVVSALLALELERAREHGVLRALGATPGELARLVLLESGSMGLLAGLYALPLGLALAAVLVGAINLRSFGWTLELELPWEPFALAPLLALAAALLAGALPARRLGRASIAAALRGE